MRAGRMPQVSGSSSLEVWIERERFCTAATRRPGGAKERERRTLRDGYRLFCVFRCQKSRQKWEEEAATVPVTTPCPLRLSGLLRASRRCGRPRTVMEHSPEWRYALHESPIAATVAAERICCMRCCTKRDRYKMARTGASEKSERLRPLHRVSWGSYSQHN